jgi:two-component system LytT family response regulator
MAGAVGRVRVAVVDDEPLARDCIRLPLEGLDDVVVVAEAADGQEAVNAIRRVAPDVVFLDVQMPGLSGFDVIRHIGVENMPVVVFVTAFEEHALKAFDVHAVDYLLKPFDDARLLEALDRARHQLLARREGELSRRLNALLAEFGSESPAGGPGGVAGSSPGTSRFAIRADDCITFVETDAVDWFEAAGNNVRLHVGAATHQIRSTMRRLMEDLDPDRFVRIHRSTIVNVRRIKEVQPWVGGDYLAILLDGTQLKVSRNYRQRLLGR